MADFVLTESRLPCTTFEVAALRHSGGASGLVFDRQLRNRAWAATIGNESLTSTAICLIGLSRAAVPLSDLGMDSGRTWQALMGLARRRRYLGALGLLLWADAVSGGPGPAEILAIAGVSIGEVSSLLPQLRTLELAWMLAGLVHEQRLRPSSTLRTSIEAAKFALIERFEVSTSTFRHADAGSPLVLRFRRWVATFADQIYPIQALALAAIENGDRRALAVASASARRMVDLQGDRGQWWWHHDPRDGSVSDCYPVYSVHQTGMAPMALRTLALAGGPDFTRAIEAGRRWIGNNELGINLVDRQAGTVWRSIERVEGRTSRLLRHVKALRGRHEDAPSETNPDLRVNYETRPYEWAWALFASALESGHKPAEHLA